MMQFEIVCKETIKPLFSTPPEHRLLQLCLFDRQAPYLYLQFLYFYQNGSNSELLKHSLSKTLTLYYPFAGRLRDEGGCFVDCNDMGVTFIEARLRCPMSEVMNTYNLQRDEIVKFLCFDDIHGKDQRFNPLMSVQLTRFECGGQAICVFLSHKLADASTSHNFMNHWAAISRSSAGGHDVPPLVPPQFNAASLFEAATTEEVLDELSPLQASSGSTWTAEEHSEARASFVDIQGEGSEIAKRNKNFVSKRFMFEGSKIAALKAMVSDKVENPSRVQVLSSFIYKVAISVSKTHQRNTLLEIPVNLRTRVVPPMPSTLSGNIISFFLTSPTTPEQKEIELWSLLSDLKRNMEEFCNKYPRKYKVEEWSALHKLHMEESMEKFRNPRDQTVYLCSSWCKFPFYDADFGSGKPVWVTSPLVFNKNLIVLMDAKDGEGIEALVCLEKEEMAEFERNQELLSFCQLKG